MINSLISKLLDMSRIWAKYLSKDEVAFIKQHKLYSAELPFARNAYNICYNITNTPKCECCNTTLKYRDFKSGYGRFCSRKCSNAHNVNQAKTTNIRRYGSTSWLQSEAGQSHSRKVSKEKYGSEVYQQSGDFKKKVKNTWSNKTASDMSELKKSRVKHNNLKYGVDHFFQTEDYRNKAQKTLNEKYDVCNPMQSDTIIQRAISSRRGKLISRIETDYNVKLDDVFEGVALYKKYKWICKECDTRFYHDLSIGHRPACPKCFPKRGTNLETKIMDLLDDLNIDYQVRVRHLIKLREVDFYIESKNIAIEVHGLRWHGERVGGKFKTYHLNKHNMCKDIGVKLIQLYEDDICDEKKFNIIKSRLSNVLGKSSNRIHARKCKVEKINGSIAKKFLVDNHIQGYAPSSSNYGLVYENEIVSIATFLPADKRVFINSKQNDCLELVRFCSKLNFNVRGAISKLIKACQRETCLDILTYSDLDWGYNTSYTKVGFEFIKESGPSFWYIKNNKRYNRFQFTKKKVKQYIENYNDDVSAYQNCLENNILTDRIWGCGNEVFKLEYK